MALGKSSIRVIPIPPNQPIIHYAEDSIFGPTRRIEDTNVNNNRSTLDPLDIMNPLNPVSVYEIW